MFYRTLIKVTARNLFLWQVQVFVLLFMISFPFGSRHLPFPGNWLEPVFEKLVEFSATSIFHIREIISLSLLSDTKALYIHVFNLFILSFFLSFFFKRIFASKNESVSYVYWFTVIISYYLGYHLLQYGFNKVFKWQFFIPEPNTLFTTVGNTPKDLLYWSSMGSSWLYNFFTGMLEVSAGLLLLFRKTRLSGAIFAFGIMLNVVMINFSFDISVKIFSLFLLLLSALIIIPHARRIYFFFIRNEMTVQKSFYPLLDSLMKRRVFFIVKTFIILLFLFDSLEIYFSTGNFNDDIAKRPLFHGAYNVKEHANGWKRAFIHRRGYFIIQAEDEKMYDFKLEYDLENNQLVLENYFTHNKYYYPFCERSDDTLVLKKDSTEIILEKIDITQLPLMQNEFHWTID